MPDALPVPARNCLIAALPRKDRQRVLAACEPVDLVFAAVLAEPGERIRHVFFPTGGFISLMTPIIDHASLEVGLVGNEGMVGATLALGMNVSPLHALVQGAGPALRMGAVQFRRELGLNPALLRGVQRYLYVVMGQLAQNAACTRFHVVEARILRKPKSFQYVPLSHEGVYPLSTTTRKALACLKKWRKSFPGA